MVTVKARNSCVKWRFKMMIYIYMALHREAKPLIKKLNLKREDVPFGFAVYGNEELGVRLVLTGVGAIAAAAGVGSSLGYFRGTKSDILINIGSCAGKSDAGKVYLCHKITDEVSGHTFYPDILCRHPFEEASLVTQPQVLCEGLEDSQLYDMEGASIYQAGSYFFGPHQMFFLKIVSDAGRGNEVSPEQLEKVMEQAADSIVDFLRELGEYQETRLQTDAPLCLDRLYEEFCCSQTMKNMLKQYVTYWTLSGVDYEEKISRMREEGKLPCKDRREGKKRLEELIKDRQQNTLDEF
jgi:nucleoside phosphorylase